MSNVGHQNKALPYALVALVVQKLHILSLKVYTKFISVTNAVI